MRRKTLIDLLQRNLDRTADEGRDWLVDLRIALERVEMENALERAGLAHGIEPTPRQRLLKSTDAVG